MKRKWNRLWLAGACFIALSASAAPTLLKPQRTITWSDFLGVNAHFLWFSPQDYSRQMEQLQALGLKWVRIDLHWNLHEPSPGNYHLGELDQLMSVLKAKQLNSLIYAVGSPAFASSAPAEASNADQYPPLPQQRYADFMAMLANRYPEADAWQVWNEPNLPAFWQPQASPKDYGALLTLTANTLRAVSSRPTVVMGGMAYFSQMPPQGDSMLLALMQQNPPIPETTIAYHPYSLSPEGDDPLAQDFILRSQTVNSALRQMRVPAIWATEWGWSSYSGPREEQPIIGKDGQADFLLRRLALMSALDFDRIFLFALSDLDERATVRDRSYGLLALDGTAKPAFNALQRFLTTTGPQLIPAAPPRLTASPDDLYGVAWTRPDGKHLWMFWSAGAGAVQLPDIAEADLIDPLSGERQRVTRQSAGLTISTKPTLQILQWP
jgi:beta-xylosidase